MADTGRIPPARVAGIGPVSIEGLEARLSAYLSAGAPEPVLEGSVQERRAVLEHVAARGDTQMRQLMARYLGEL